MILNSHFKLPDCIFIFTIFIFENSLMGQTLCGRSQGQFHMGEFDAKNTYTQNAHHSQQNIEAVARTIAPSHPPSNCKDVAAYILGRKHKIFSDAHFQKVNASQEHSKKLSKLYDYKRLKIERVYLEKQTQLDIFYQRQVQLAYVSTVMYLICRNPHLKQQLMITHDINQHHAYLVNLFCNGKPCRVVVDDSVPVQKGKLKFTNLAHGKQIWPFLLEKAWAKQIGNYEKARGLSPEDCFEEITGIPAYSFSIKDNSYNVNRGIIKEAFGKEHWIALIGHITRKGLKSRQVFYIENIYEDGQIYLLRSPYLDFDFPNREREEGSIKMQLSEAIKQFEFGTIGYYMNGYRPSSLSVQTKRDEEVVFEVRITKKEPINIRFIQFYRQYLEGEEERLYEYSPVFLELYDEEKMLVKECQGLPESIEGVRSSNLANNIYVELKPALYYLRLQIVWINEKELNTGNLVAYASPGTVQMAKSQHKTLELSNIFIQQSLKDSNVDVINNSEQEINVRCVEQNHKYILGIENVGSTSSVLKIHFKGSQNIRVNHFNLHKLAMELEIQPQKMRILEILPAEPSKPFFLAPFDIFKI